MEWFNEIYFDIVKRLFFPTGSFKVLDQYQNQISYSGWNNYEIILQQKKDTDKFDFAFQARVSFRDKKIKNGLRWAYLPSPKIYTFPVINVVDRNKVIHKPSEILATMQTKYFSKVLLLKEYSNPEISLDHFTEFMKHNSITLIYKDYWYDVPRKPNSSFKFRNDNHGGI